MPTIVQQVQGHTKALNKAQSNKISQLFHEGYPQDQSVAISYSEREKGGLPRLLQSHGGINPKTGKAGGS
jgi:hypothetical protein